MLPFKLPVVSRPPPLHPRRPLFYPLMPSYWFPSYFTRTHSLHDIDDSMGPPLQATASAPDSDVVEEESRMRGLLQGRTGEGVVVAAATEKVFHRRTTRKPPTGGWGCSNPVRHGVGGANTVIRSRSSLGLLLEVACSLVSPSVLTLASS